MFVTDIDINDKTSLFSTSTIESADSNCWIEFGIIFKGESFDEFLL